MSTPRRPLPVLLTNVLAALLVALLVLIGGPSSSAAADDAEQEVGAPEAALTGIAQLDAGREHTCAALTSGEARCWGSSFFRQSGDGNLGTRLLPVTVLNPTGTGPLRGVVQVTAGTAHSCARLQNGQARCWGYNSDAALGVGDQVVHERALPVSNADGTGRLTDVRDISAGWDHTCARVAGGQVRCWGRNAQGQIGDGSFDLRNRPVAVADIDGAGALTGVSQVSAGVQFSCARLRSGRAACWGNNANNQVAPGSTSDRVFPTLVTNGDGSAPLEGVRSVAAGYFSACALLDSGQVRCWGALPGGTEQRPVAVLKANGQPLTGIVGLSVSSAHYCAVTTTGRAKCWGANGVSQLGDRTTTDRATPVAVSNPEGTSALTGVAAVTLGESHTCLRLTSGEARCGGLNDKGQLGDGTTATRDRPIGVRR